MNASPSRRQKLAETAKSLGLKLPQALLLLAQERFLERLVSVDKKRSLIWKGGSLVLRRYSSLQPPRFTTDIDLLVRGKTIDDAVQLLMKACEVDLEDGFSFIYKKQTPMKRDTPYGGERLELSWKFENKPISELLRIDLCAGDDVDAVEVKLEDLFLEAPQGKRLSISIYPPEFIFAEKLETLVRFGTGNTRLKDFIDLWSLIQKGLDDNRVYAAVTRCFQRRGTAIEPKDWQEVLRDNQLASILEQARERNFKDLQIPGIPTLFADLLKYLKRLESLF